ncbi:hypothetical protein BJ508DRAFT_374706 [Ascobolus immersus RN42]|uniref:Uncharacterized protein n=1 Tax=Ascobolus immersus RN42 TaxID=1160509 RepID=A0A3N4ICG7_ASCIM|nr:hypothetical protein BJ508DRAFT_374706 [Ascobolus immersus RN42]
MSDIENVDRAETESDLSFHDSDALIELDGDDGNRYGSFQLNDYTHLEHVFLPTSFPKKWRGDADQPEPEAGDFVIFDDSAQEEKLERTSRKVILWMDTSSGTSNSTRQWMFAELAALSAIHRHLSTASVTHERTTKTVERLQGCIMKLLMGIGNVAAFDDPEIENPILQFKEDSRIPTPTLQMWLDSLLDMLKKIKNQSLTETFLSAREKQGAWQSQNIPTGTQSVVAAFENRILKDIDDQALKSLNKSIEENYKRYRLLFAPFSLDRADQAHRIVFKAFGVDLYRSESESRTKDHDNMVAYLKLTPAEKGKERFKREDPKAIRGRKLQRTFGKRINLSTDADVLTIDDKNDQNYEVASGFFHCYGILSTVPNHTIL